MLVGDVLGAPPGDGRGGGIGTGRVGRLLQEPGELALQGPQAFQLGPDLGQPPAQQGLGVPAGALAPVGDLAGAASSPTRS